MGAGVSATAVDAFIGRDEELAELREALRSAAAGAGAVRLICGEPGIGKSRLARELAAHAEADGLASGWGRTWEAGGAPPYWPWIRALRELVHHYDEKQLREALSRARAVTVLLPELAELDERPVLGSAPGQASVDERFAVFEAVSTLLAELGRIRPALLVLEDVHAADEASLLLLQFVATDLRVAAVLVLATFRDVEARQDQRRGGLIGDVARQGRVLHLSGLSPEQIRTLVESRGAPGAAAVLLADVEEATSGNPFFIEELLRLHRVGGRLDEASIPLGVRETVRSRLQLLPAATHDVVVTAAVYGRSFDEHILARILDCPVEQVRDLLRPALDAALVVRDADELRFRHGLIREVLVDQTPAAERARIHAQVVQALESLPTISRERHLSELAHHAVRAVSGNAARAIHHARNAGDAAMRAFAFEEAVGQYESALQVLALTPGDESRPLDLLVDLIKARAAAGDVDGARETARQARALAQRVGSAPHLAAIALAYPSLMMAVWRTDEELLTLLREALAALAEDGDPAMRAALLSTLVVQSYFTRDPVQELARQALALAEASGDPRALAHACFAAQNATRGAPLSPELLEQDRSVQLARQADDLALETSARLRRIGAWLELGAVARADAEIVEYQQMVERVRRPIDVWWADAIQAMRAIYAGRYAEAEQRVQGAVDYGYRFAGEQALSVFGAQDHLVHLDRRPWPETVASLMAFPEDFRQRLPVRTALVRARAALGQQDQVREELAEFAADSYALLPQDRSSHTCLVQLADAAADVGDAERARELVAMLEPHAGRLAVAPPFAVFGPFDLFRGRLLHLLGRHQDAAEAYQSAMRLSDRTGGRPWGVRSRFHQAKLLAETGRHQQARELFARVRDEARELDLVLLEQAASTALESAPGAAEAPAVPITATARVTMAREGEYWSIDDGSRVLRLRDSRGLQHLTQLIRNPGKEIHALELAAQGPGAPRSVSAADGLTTSSDDLGPVLDERAKKEYRARIEELRRDIEEATEANDTERAARAREEHDLFVAELSRALGLHGRDRPTGSAAEQARINVSKAVRAAIRRVCEQDAGLGDELMASVRTGSFCTYLPLAGQRCWEVTAPR